MAVPWAPAQLVAGGYTRTTNVQDRDGKKLLTGQQSQLAWRRSKGATLFPLTTLLRRCWGRRSYNIPTSTARPETCSSSPLLSEGFLSPVSTQMFPCYRQFSRETNAEAERGDVGGQVVQSPGGMVDGQVVHFSVLAETEGLIHGDVGGPVLAEAGRWELHCSRSSPCPWRTRGATLSVSSPCQWRKRGAALTTSKEMLEEVDLPTTSQEMLEEEKKREELRSSSHNPCFGSGCVKAVLG